jgi:hypothetical protein
MRADGRIVALHATSLEELQKRRHAVDDRLTITESIVNDRRASSRPIAFFSQYVTNQRTGKPTVIAPRFASDTGWGINEVGSAGFGSDRFPLVSPNQLAACATHIAEIACYPPGHPVDFRVFFATSPINYAEIDSLANDLPESSTSAIYIVLSSEEENRVVLNHRANANAVAFVPSWRANGFNAVNPVLSSESYNVVSHNHLTDAWANLLLRIVPRAQSSANVLSHTIAMHMKRHGSIAFTLSDANAATIQDVDPVDATGLLQLVKCNDASCESNQLHARVHGPEVYMPSLAHRVATDTSVLLHAACSSIYYGCDPWKDAIRICKQLSDNKSPNR